MPKLPFPSQLDSAALENAACPRQFFNGAIRRWLPVGGSIHLVAGGAYAAGLQAIRQGFYNPASPAYGDSDKALAGGIRAAIADWGTYEALPDDRKQLWRIIEALDLYTRQWPLASDLLKPHLLSTGRPAVELSFTIPLSALHPETNEPLQYSGRIDLIGEFEGGLWVVDDKTCTQLGTTWFHKWDLRGQFQGYMRAAHDFGLPVVGTIIRAACFRSNSTEFAEATVPFRKWLADEWLDSLNYRLSILANQWQHGYWPKVYNELCSLYGGCDYKPLCSYEHEEIVAALEYEIVHWDPLTHTEKHFPIARPAGFLREGPPR